MLRIPTVCLLILCALPVARSAHANGVFQSVTGDVRTGEGAGSLDSVSAAQRFGPGTRVVTGEASRAVLRFDDGHTLILGSDSEVRIAQYRFERDRPEIDAMRIQVVTGAIRSVTGLMGERSRSRVVVSLPQADIGLKGTDFMAALAGAAYVSVMNGSVVVTNAAGRLTLDPQAAGSVAAATNPPAQVSDSELPAPVRESFSALRGVAVGPGIEPGSVSPGAYVVGPRTSLAGSAAAVLLGVVAVTTASATQSAAAVSHH